MLSRSSSAYQPLGGGPDDRVGGGGGGGGGGKNKTDDDDLEKGQEMTSIAVISQHPFRSSSQSPMISTVVAGNPVGGSGAHGVPELDHDYVEVVKDKESTPWTNFHFVMCVGIVGFFIFWILLLCRMYLPPEYQLWSTGSTSSSSSSSTATKADPASDSTTSAFSSSETNLHQVQDIQL